MEIVYIAYFCLIYLSVLVQRHIFKTHFISFTKCGNFDLTQECLNTALIQIPKWSKDRGSKHSRLIFALFDAGMVPIEISCICLESAISTHRGLHDWY